MNIKVLFYFIFVTIKKERSKYLSLFLISTILIFILSSFMFVVDASKKDINILIQNQPSLIVKQIKSGKVIDIDEDIQDQFLSIHGVLNSNCRVYGRYYYEPAEEYFNIIGVDFFSKQNQKYLKKLINTIDLDKFLAKPYMIVGSGVKKFLDYYQYKGYYSFRPSNRSIIKLYIYSTFQKDLNIVSSDTIIMDISYARQILDIKNNKCSDISLDIENLTEQTTILDKIKAKYWDMLLISKQDISKYYTNFFSYKSSLFFLLYFLSFITFILILYQRYSLINSMEKKQIAIFRILGWSILDILKLKIIENIIVFFSAFILGVNLAYFYIFVLNAPILQNIFFGFLNLSTDIHFVPTVDMLSIFSIFLFFIIPLISIVLYPIWKIAITSPTEALKY